MLCRKIGGQRTIVWLTNPEALLATTALVASAELAGVARALLGSASLLKNAAAICERPAL